MQSTFGAAAGCVGDFTHSQKVNVRPKITKANADAPTWGAKTELITKNGNVGMLVAAFQRKQAMR